MSFNTNDKIVPFKDQDYYKLRKQYSRTNLFKDPLFPAVDSSIFKKKPIPPGTVWKRPFEIHANPKFSVNGFSRHDFDQGSVCDCWFVAACAGMMRSKTVFNRVVPQDQGFENDYNGMFHFRFWFEGEWVDVVIDDRLPVNNHNRLIFMSCKEDKNEFWSALLEKAYAKLYGSYEALSYGTLTEAVGDLSGAISELIHIDPEKKDSYWGLLTFAYKKEAIIGCGINKETDQKMEHKFSNGLVAAHQYTVTRLVIVNVDGKNVRLIRLRNPWGMHEWTGAWSDGSKEWKSLSESDKNKIGYTNEADGEFWMSFNDFVKSFSKFEICHLNADSMVGEEIKPGFYWKCRIYHGEWIKGKNAGGSESDTYWSNPQYLFQVNKTNRSDGKAHVCAALEIKGYRLSKNHFGVSIRLYRVLVGVDGRTRENPGFKRKDLEYISHPDDENIVKAREISKKYLVQPDYYVIIPNTFYSNSEANYILRIFSLSPKN